MKASFFITLLFTVGFANAQSADSLNPLNKASFPAFYSKGYEQRAASITLMIGNTLSYHKKLLTYEPAISLFVLDTTDWKIYSSKGAVYGMPHYNIEKKALILAAQDNPFWRSFLPPAGKL